MKQLTASGRIALGAGLFPLLMGSLALAGWWLDAPVFQAFLPSAGLIKANAALGLVLAGAALSLNSTPNVRRWEWFAAAVLSRPCRAHRRFDAGGIRQRAGLRH